MARRVVFLGTNGWFDTETGNTISILVEWDGFFIVLDAGNGIWKLDRYLPTRFEKPVWIFLSHFHLDHIIGLHILSKFKLPGGVVISGPTGAREHLGAIMRPPFTKSPDQIPFSVDFRELPEEASSFPFRLECLPLRHKGLTLGFRFTVGDHVLAFCPDTGYCENAVQLARNADVLITECAYGPGVKRMWPHLNPEEAARIATEAEAKRLLLVHFDPRYYPTLASRMEAEKAALDLFPAVEIAVDDLVIDF